MPTSKRVSRLRSIALVVLLVGGVLAFLAGVMIPAQVVPVTGTLSKVVNYTSSQEGGTATQFNWLFAILVAGPAIIASSVLYGAAEIAVASRRGSRGRSSERTGLEVGDEV